MSLFSQRKGIRPVQKSIQRRICWLRPSAMQSAIQKFIRYFTVSTNRKRTLRLSDCWNICDTIGVRLVALFQFSTDYRTSIPKTRESINNFNIIFNK